VSVSAHPARHQRSRHDEVGVAGERRGRGQADAEAAGEDPLGIRTRSIQHETCPDREALARQLVTHLDRPGPAAGDVETHGLDVVGTYRAQGRCALHEGEDQPRRVVHLSVAEHAGTGEARPRQVREALERLGTRQEAARRDVARRVWYPAVAAEREEVVERHARTQRGLPFMPRP
jgi:hypothetical protein